MLRMGLGVALVLALSGCMIPTLPEPIDAGAIWTQGTPTLGDVTVVDGVAIAYLSQGENDLQVRGWDVATGRLLWTHDAIPGAGAIGLFLTVPVVTVGGSSYVAVLDYVDDWHTVVVIDVATGEPLEYETRGDSGWPFAFWADGRPDACVDDPDQFCVVGYPRDSDEVRAYRLDIEAREMRPEPDGAIPGNARTLYSGVWSTNERRATGGQEILGYSENGTTLWTRPYEDVFGPGYSSDNGWSWEYDADNDQLVSFGAKRDPAVLRYELTDNSLVALDRATGSTNWLVRGVDPYCAASDGTPGLRCRYESGYIEFPDERSPGEFFDLDVTLEGYDPATGEATWSLPLGDQEGAVTTYESVGFRGGATQRIVPSARGAIVVDIADGTVRELPPDEIVPCLTTTTYRFAEYSSLGAASADYYGAPVVEACTLDGDPVDFDSRPSDLWITTAGVDAGDGIYIVATTDGLRAYRLD